MKKRFIALLLCCVMIFTLSPSLIASAAADDETVQQVEQTSEAKDTDQQPEQQPDQAQNEDKNETQATEEPKTEEPMPEEPKTEEPKTEEPKAEEPKAEDETTIPAAEQSDVPVESEIITPTVNFTNVAPFLPPVSGGVRMLRAPLAARAAANFAANDAANDTATDNGMKISKTATANADGSYTITLEAYATGSKVISEVTEDVPTDIILVLDQSGSMDQTMSTYGFQEYTNRSNSYLYNRRHNGGNDNLYYELDDGSYATVSVSRIRGESVYSYTECQTDWNNYQYYYYENDLYVKIGDGYQKVTLTRTGEFLNRVYTYTFPNGDTVVSNGASTSPGNFDGKGPLHVRSESQGEYTYTYTYTDKDGNPQTIGTSTGEDTQPTGFTLYERYQTGSVTRLQALKTAVTNFAEEVAKKAAGKDGNIATTDDNINHRIAVVGFASGSRGNDSYPSYVNTELFIGANQYNYNVDASNHYGSAFQDMNTQAGYDNVMASKNALAASGATHVDLGIEMANGIFGANPIGQNEQRNRVMIVFTDGVPSSWSDYDSTVANNAITKANTTKSSTGYGATVYTIGIFSGADATSAGSESGDESQIANWFMQNLSSNNGKVQTPSYYLSAADADSLNSIFQQISDQIETGGSSTTLSEETVIKDIIAPAFTLPQGTETSDITLETYQCTGKDSDGNYTWSMNDTAMGATAAIGSTDTSSAVTTDNQISVTGFDFAENWVGTETSAEGATTYRGNKLVISFTVMSRDGFLGGNNIYTNAGAGVYENANAETPVLTFEQPQVNVPIDTVTVTAEDKNVYLLGGLTAEQLKSGAVVECGDVTLNIAPGATNYGLEEWQTAYVDITVVVKDEDGNVITTGLTDLTGDTTYTISVTVAPKKTASAASSGTAATAQTGANAPAANINVFKPELTFKDSEVYYGADVPTNNDYSSNQVGAETWKHGDTVSTDAGVTMLGTKPELNISYTPDASKISGGKYTKQDVRVKATVKIGTDDVTQYTTFVHQNCTAENCGWTAPTTPGDPAFLLHVKTCTLNITKTGGAANESYVFNVYKDRTKYSEVTVWGNGTETLVELPVGTYTIQEDTGWSWRYPNPTYTPINGVTLSKTGASGTITCANKKANDYWLNGFSTVVENVYGVARVEQ